VYTRIQCYLYIVYTKIRYYLYIVYNKIQYYLYSIHQDSILLTSTIVNNFCYNQIQLKTTRQSDVTCTYMYM